MFSAFAPATYMPPTYDPGYDPAGVVLVPGPFNEYGITDITVGRFDTDLHLRFASEWPAGSHYQIYVNHTLKWVGTATTAVLPGIGPEVAIIHVGNVAPEGRNADYSAILPDVVPAGSRARLKWAGGRWLSPTLAGFHVYMSRTPGGPIDWSNRVGDVPARHGAGWGDGFGRGPFGRGPFGRGAISYRWTSGPLATGIYTLGVRAYDASGTESADATTTIVAVQAPPAVVPPFADGTRMRSTFDPASHAAALTWNESI
jgi:hypothetical protein